MTELSFISISLNVRGEAEGLWLTEVGTKHRRAFIPGEDLVGVPDEHKTQVNALWTPAFVDAWKAENSIDQPVSLDDQKATRNAEVTAKRDSVFGDGYSPSSGPLAGHTLQVRNETDKINWLTSQASYSAAVMAGHGAVQGATFRTADNDTIVTTFAEALEIIVVGMAKWGQEIMQRSWDLKDEIDAAADVEALDAIDITTGWPE